MTWIEEQEKKFMEQFLKDKKRFRELIEKIYGTNNHD